MRGRLVSQNIGHDPALGEFRNNLSAVPYQPYRNIFFLADRVLYNPQRFIKRRHHEVAVASPQPFLDPLRIDIDS